MRAGLVVLTLLVACESGQEAVVDEPANPWTGPLVSKAEPGPEVAPQAQGDGDGDGEGPEEVEFDWADGPFDKDLDGDGKPETISWICERPQRVHVNKAVFKEDGRYADLLGSTVTTIDLDPETPGVQLVFIGDEHEEAGPDRHVILNYRKGKLELLWEQDARVSFYVDGSWESEQADCNDIDLVYTTTTEIHRLEKGKVVTERDVSVEKIEEGSCAKP